MHCHLLVPDLFWPEPKFRDIYDQLATPALDLLLAKGRRRQTHSEPGAMVTAETWLCEQFGVERQQDWPIAPYSLLADGGEPGDQHWLRADPVHLKLEGSRVVLADSSAFALSQAEAERLTDSLNAHFAADGLVFLPLRPDRWYLRSDAVPALETTPLAAAAGRSIDSLLPRGSDAQTWRARLNEVQMLLHAHAANEMRERAGELPVNSVWLWGGGTRSEAVAPFNAVWSRDAFAAGLALAAHGVAHDLPDSATDLLRASADEGVQLILLDPLRSAAQYDDPHAWREALLRLERDWFAPLLEALRLERIGMLSLHALGPGSVLSAEATRGDLRRFWRRVKPLAAYTKDLP